MSRPRTSQFLGAVSWQTMNVTLTDNSFEVGDVFKFSGLGVTGAAYVIMSTDGKGNYDVVDYVPPPLTTRVYLPVTRMLEL